MFSHYSPRILVFDSGIGGMGVVQALRNLAPSLHIDYLADTALFPYGEQNDFVLQKRIVTLLHSAYQKLFPDLIIIACNTASTLALSAVREALKLPIVGCVPPIRWAGRVSTSRTIGLLSTTATARRPYVSNLHQQFAADCRLIVHGSPQLAHLAEKAFQGEEISASSIRNELNKLFKQSYGDQIDTVGLGCTHYTFLMPAFQRIGPPHIMWLDPAPAVAQQALHRLRDKDNVIESPPRKHSLQQCLVTSLTNNMIDLKERTQWLGFTHWSLFTF